MQLNRTITSSLAFLIISASGLAAAGPDKKENNEKDVLRGPKVVTTQPADRDHDTMQPMDDKSDKMRDANDHADRPIVLREYLFAIHQLRSAQSADNPLNLSETQQEQIRTIVADHRKAMQEFNEQNQDRIQKLRDHMRTQNRDRNSDQAEKKPTDDQSDRAPRNRDADRPNPDDRSNQAREKLRHFMENAPANKETMIKLMKVLTPEQQSTLKAHIHKARAQRGMSDRRPDGADRRRGNDSETDRPNVQRRRLNRDQTQRTDKRNTERDKRNKPDKPAPDDD